MSKKQTILKAFRIAANVLTDSGVLFIAGNTIFGWHAGGVPGILCNLAALTAAAGFRLRLELKKDSHSEEGTPQGLLDNRNASFYGAIAAQLVVAAVAFPHIRSHHTKALMDFAIPICNAIGSTFVINRRDSERDFTFAAALVMASSEQFPLHSSVPVMALAALPSVIYASATALSIYRSLRKTEKGIDPLYLFAAGLGVAVVINHHDPVLVKSLAAWGTAYLSLKANNAHKGVVESVRAMSVGCKRYMLARAAHG